MKRISITFSCLLICLVGFSQQSDSILTTVETQKQQVLSQNRMVQSLQKIKISGYIQTQFQYGEKNATLKIGALNEDPEKSFNRIGIRRGRLRIAYQDGIITGVHQLDIVEKGISLIDVYLKIKDIYLVASLLKVRAFDCPFGFEISHSSGLGFLWSIYKNLRCQTSYQIVKNETSEYLVDYRTNRKEDVFTLRLQYKF